MCKFYEGAVDYEHAKRMSVGELNELVWEARRINKAIEDQTPK